MRALPSCCFALRIVIMGTGRWCLWVYELGAVEGHNPERSVLIVLAYMVLGYFAFLIVGGLLNGIWEIIRDSMDQFSAAYGNCSRCGSSTHTAKFHTLNTRAKYPF
jgi:hypothetical protein